MQTNIPHCVAEIVSRHPLVKERLREVLKRDTRIELRPTVWDSNEGPHVFVIDKASHRHPVRLLRRSAARFPSARFVVVADETSQGARALLYLGVHGLVRFRDLDTCLAPAVLAAHSGRISFPADPLHESAPLRQSKSAYPTGSRLTERELLVLSYLERRFSNSEIAAGLGLRLSTVKAHVAAILQKLAAHSRRELALEHLAVAHPHRGLLRLGPDRARSRLA